MAEPTGKLTEEQKQSVIKWLTEKKAIKECPFCTHPQWFIADYLVIDNGFSQGGIILGGQAYPLVAVVCGNCSFMRMHSAVALGLVPAAEAPRAPEEEVKNGD